MDDTIIDKVVEFRLAEEIKSGIQTIQYQLITLMTCNGQAPFVTMYMYLDEVPAGRIRDDLAMLIANVCNTVNPDTVVIGGGVSKAGEVLLNGIKKNIGKYIFHGASEVDFVLATLGNDAGIYGALELIRKGE